MHRQTRRVLLLAVWAALTVAVPLVSAQEATTSEAPAAQQVPQGGGTLMLLLGIGFVLIVGGVWLARERVERERDSA